MIEFQKRYQVKDTAKIHIFKSFIIRCSNTVFIIAVNHIHRIVETPTKYDEAEKAYSQNYPKLNGPTLKEVRNLQESKSLSPLSKNGLTVSKKPDNSFSTINSINSHKHLISLTHPWLPIISTYNSFKICQLYRLVVAKIYNKGNLNLEVTNAKSYNDNNIVVHCKKSRHLLFSATRSTSK